MSAHHTVLWVGCICVCVCLYCAPCVWCVIFHECWSTLGNAKKKKMPAGGGILRVVTFVASHQALLHASLRTCGGSGSGVIARSFMFSLLLLGSLCFVFAVKPVLIHLFPSTTPPRPLVTLLTGDTTYVCDGVILLASGHSSV